MLKYMHGKRGCGRYPFKCITQSTSLLCVVEFLCFAGAHCCSGPEAGNQNVEAQRSAPPTMNSMVPPLQCHCNNTTSQGNSMQMGVKQTAVVNI